MKAHFIICLTSFVFITHAFSQPECPNDMVIESPIIAKPSDVSIVSSTCSAVTIKWKGNANQNYLISGTSRDAANTVTMLSSPSNISCDNNFNCTATIPVMGNSYITWSVQAIGTEDGRTFYSYPTLGAQDYFIAACLVNNTAPHSVITEKEVDSSNVRIYPNPVSTTLNIDVKTMGISKTSIKDVIRIFDGNGKAVLIKQATAGNTQVNVRQLTPGTYFIRMENSNGKIVYNAKFIKE